MGGGGGGAFPGHWTVFPFPWLGNNKRFDVTQDLRVDELDKTQEPGT